MDYKTKAKYNRLSKNIYEGKGGPCYYLYIYYLPWMHFAFTWNEWTKRIRIFGIGFEIEKLPF